MALPESHVTIIDDQDDLIMDFELESDDSVSDSEDEGSDEDPGEVGEIDVDEVQVAGGVAAAASDGEGVEEVGLEVRAWQYEPLPHGRPGDNVGDARPLPDENEFNSLSACHILY